MFLESGHSTFQFALKLKNYAVAPAKSLLTSGPTSPEKLGFKMSIGRGEIGSETENKNQHFRHSDVKPTLSLTLAYKRYCCDHQQNPFPLIRQFKKGQV